MPITSLRGPDGRPLPPELVAQMLAQLEAANAPPPMNPRLGPQLNPMAQQQMDPGLSFGSTQAPPATLPAITPPPPVGALPDFSGSPMPSTAAPIPMPQAEPPSVLPTFITPPQGPPAQPPSLGFLSGASVNEAPAPGPANVTPVGPPPAPIPLTSNLPGGLIQATPYAIPPSMPGYAQPRQGTPFRRRQPQQAHNAPLGDLFGMIGGNPYGTTDPIHALQDDPAALYRFAFGARL